MPEHLPARGRRLPLCVRARRLQVPAYRPSAQLPSSRKETARPSPENPGRPRRRKARPPARRCARPPDWPPAGGRPRRRPSRRAGPPPPAYRPAPRRTQPVPHVGARYPERFVVQTSALTGSFVKPPASVQIDGATAYTVGGAGMAGDIGAANGDAAVLLHKDRRLAAAQFNPFLRVDAHAFAVTENLRRR